VRSVPGIVVRRKGDEDLLASAPLCQGEVVSVLNRRICRHAPSVYVDLFVGSVSLTGEKKIHERKISLVEGDIGAFEEVMSVDII
jgi:hypothetical protein